MADVWDGAGDDTGETASVDRGGRDLLAGLNAPQREAVTTTEGPLLVLAGPGSGKTRVITNRIAYLLSELGISPWRILAVTFTNKAAREMKERLEALVGSPARDLAVGTYHAICARILRREAGQAGIALDRNFTIYDDDDQQGLVKRIIRDMDLNEKQYSPRMIHSIISRAKNDLYSPIEFEERTNKYIEEIAARVYKRYDAALRENNAVDFDDLILLTYQLWRRNPTVLEEYQRRYQYIHVDEFQDTNRAQYELVRLLGAGTPETPGHMNVCAVADDDQSIYSWRGANPKVLFQFEQDFPNTRVVLLEQNYRSTQIVLDAAHGVVSHNRGRKDKKLWTERAGGEKIVLHEAYNEEEEGSYIVNEVRRLVGRGEARLSDCAVMYRTNAQSRALEEQFIRSGTPYVVVGSKKFYERKEIKDVLAYLRLIANPQDTVSLQRIINVPTRKIGEKTFGEFLRWTQQEGMQPFEALARIEEHPTLATASKRALTGFAALLADMRQKARELQLPALLDHLLAHSGYAQELRDGTEEGEERWNNVLELRRVAEDFSEIDPETALALFLENVALVSGADTAQTGENGTLAEDERKKDAVTLITLHAAKGLEFPVVFLAGLEEGILPHSRSLENQHELEEERRLAYVGITRAMRRLYLVRAFRRSFYGGSSNTQEPSRFLDEIPAELMAPTYQRNRPQRAGGSAGGAFGGRSTPEWGRRSPSSYPSSPASRPSSSSGTRPLGGPSGASSRGSSGGWGSMDEATAPAEEPAQEQKLSPGDRVIHRLFGPGLVLKVDESPGKVEVQVLFDAKSVGKKTLDQAFAGLQKL
ncbi:MAG TPA: UvrD-helicase domain-containing protein [Ktedonobacterales bacterium]|jgi:DNA helicase-2/ATP-dependent DNA helicase PcrA